MQKSINTISVFYKMGVLHLLTGDKRADHGLHAVVFIVIGMIQLLAINEHPDNKLIAGVAGTALGTTWVSGIYHIGLFFQTCLKKDSKELNTGEALRNLLTTLSLVLVTGNIGVLNQMDVDVGMKFDGNAHEIVMAYSFLSVILLVLARLLDMFFDHETAGGVLSIDAVKVEAGENCDEEVEPMWGESALNGRIFITHVLLLASVVTSWLLWLNDDQKLKHIGDGDKTILMLSAILTLVHFILYPLVYALSRSERTKDMVVKVMTCGGMCKKEKDDPKDLTLESLNRIPLIRWLVTTTILLGFSFLTGHTAQNERTQLVLLNLVLYIGADAVGRHVV